jgi:hypothetical protein
MKIRRGKLRLLIFWLAVCGLALTGGEKTMAENRILYRVSLEKNRKQTITVKQSGQKLTLFLEGFGRPVELNADGGGTMTCRTIIEHNSEKGSVRLSLAIPDPRARCAMLPSFVSIEIRDPDISLDEEPLKKITGGDATLRSVVRKIFGELEQEG